MTIGSLTAVDEPARVAPRTRLGLPELTKLATVALQVGLVVLLAHQLRLESVAAVRLLTLGAAGWLVHALLPFRYRLPWFLLLSLAGIGLVLPPVAAVWLVGIGLVLVATCHLPVAFGLRVGLLVAAALVLAALRAQLVPSPVPPAVWPILGSLFMFRLAIYLYDLKHAEQAPAPIRSLSYFFLLPNPAFPLFPVVDYKTFERTYYDGDEFRIYRKGVEWMFRGVVHLALYRIVYHHLVVDAAEVATLGDLAGHVVTVFLLYLRVSGQFHLIVGLLQLFGFNLPETHHRYLLASSFTDLWRRINIYWKDFMLKLVYYPSFFRLRRHGSTLALVGATMLVFVATWALHSYQWFWLLGEPLLAAHDALFWGILGALVVAAALREAKGGRRHRKPAGRWDGALAARRVATVGLFCVLWSLWTAEAVPDWLDMWDAAVRTDAVELLTVLGGLTAAFALAGFSWGEGARLRPERAESVAQYVRSGARLGLGMLALALVTSPPVARLPGGTASAVLASVADPSRNARDEALEVRGYYEDLNRAQAGIQRGPGGASARTLREQLRAGGFMSYTDGLLQRQLAPSVRVTGGEHVYQTNRWGMRDGDHALEKPPETYRIALLGPSTVMGWGVAGEADFESLLEARLNRELRAAGARRYEVLNFGVPGYSPLQQLLQFEERVGRFNPDAALFVLHRGDPVRILHTVADAVLRGIDVRHPELRRVLAEAGVDSTMSKTRLVRRLWPYRDSLTDWTLARMARLAREAGAVPVAVAIRLPGYRFYRDDVPLDRASRAGMLTIDLRDAYEGRREAELHLDAEDKHPNAAGHAVLAERLYLELWRHRDALGLVGPVAGVRLAGPIDPEHPEGE
ncbi:MAG TPA: SGNH/GDSL hydrolase family protein [Gemmatimonadales bacterium]|nr:SGNH/GDSL hydrolase family protein [Gemmatimonadales bacterium]